MTQKRFEKCLLDKIGYSSKTLGTRGLTSSPPRHHIFILHFKCNILSQITGSKEENYENSKKIRGQETLLRIQIITSHAMLVNG